MEHGKPEAHYPYEEWVDSLIFEDFVAEPPLRLVVHNTGVLICDARGNVLPPSFVVKLLRSIGRAYDGLADDDFDFSAFSPESQKKAVW